MTNKTPCFMPLCSIQREHQAMATRWRCWLAGTDEQHLHTVADWWADEIDRWDRLLSKFDPASEVTRLNRAAVGKPCKVQRELWELLVFCEQARQATHRVFDITASSRPGYSTPHETCAAAYQLDDQQELFAWTTAARQLDFGGVAKGWALDQLAPVLQQHGVEAALLDAGGSSLLTWDNAGDETPWLVSLSTGDDDTCPRLLTTNAAAADSAGQRLVELGNAALSYSATRAAGTTSGQTIDPRAGRELPERRACAVITKSAAWAEVLSTTALCMGEAEAAEYIKEGNIAACRLGWLDEMSVRWHESAN